MQFNLQFKLLIAVASVIIFTLSILTYLSVNSQRILLHDSFRDLAITLSQALDAGITSRVDLNDVDKLQSNIYKMIWLNPNIIKISISLPSAEGLKIVASNDTTLIGSVASQESLSSYQEGIILTKILTEPDGIETLEAITPVHVGGQHVGTYDIRLSFSSLEKTISETQRQFLLGSIITVSVIISTLFLLIRITVINPIKELQKGMEIIGAGSLDQRIKIQRRDEIGELASGFNEMAKKLQERTEALRQEKVNLEKKVKQRTKEVEKSKKELQERIEQMEKFHKLAVDRELKMVELKKNIRELETELKSFKPEEKKDE